jgi:signal peptidase
VRGALGRVGQVVAWFAILLVTGVLAAAVLVPRLAGATPYAVLSGSMRPDLPEGTLVVVEPVDADELRVGDVVTYQLESGAGTVVTHRVVGVTTSLDGEVSFVTQGDANDAADEEPVRPVQVRGRLWYAVPYLGHANRLLTGQQRQVAVYLVAGGLLGYAVLMFTGALRDRKKEKEEEPVG